MNYNWNNEKLKKKFDREYNSAIGHPVYNFTENEVKNLYLSEEVFKTKSPNIWRKLTLAFILGKLSGIKSVDEGLTPIKMDPLEDILARFEIIYLYANYDEDLKCYGDIYDKIEDVIKEHPNEKILVGYGIMDNLNRSLSDEVDEWINTYEEAKRERTNLINKFQKGKTI